ncbi:MAG: Sulfite exporter TauE/SafE [bacterium ADurb.Bin429]|nr:MAG: Sulfite exporter TauE/SafE [bacterium ADurb.Bin429]
MRQTVSAIGIGIVAGLFSGLLGVGGGVLLVPAMVLLLHYSQHRAHGTSLAVILFVAVAGLSGYIRAGQISWPIAGGLAVGGILGAVLGARLAGKLPAATLRRVFGAFLILVALRMLYDVAGALVWGHSAVAAENGLAMADEWPALVSPGIGLVAGILSGLLGVGGGIILVPAMVLLLGLSQTMAQGISLAVIIPTAISGAVVHYRQGNIQLRDVLWLAVGGVAGGLGGSELALVLPVLALRGLFGVLMVVVGISMVLPKQRAT